MLFPSRPVSLAQLNTLRLIQLCFWEATLTFSCIFSHTRGTPRNTVGRTSFSVSINEPCIVNDNKNTNTNNNSNNNNNNNNNNNITSTNTAEVPRSFCPAIFVLRQR